MIIIGNKCDLEEERMVQKEEGEKIAENYGFQFYEVSNKTGVNVDEAVNCLVSKILEKKSDQESERSANSHNGIKLDKDSEKARTKKCAC